MTDIEHAKKYAEDSISLAISMHNPKAEIIAEYACLYGLTYKNDEIDKLKKENEKLRQQIEKMKCCHSCKSHKLNNLKNCQTCDVNYSNWELAE